MKYIPLNIKPFQVGQRWRMKRDQRCNQYVKWMVDPFRDYCFKKLNFKPKKKKRLIYVPRIAPAENKGGEKDIYGSRSCRVENPFASRKEYFNRYIDDSDFEKRMQQWCNKNGYEYVHWQNSSLIPIEEQMKMYAESEIVIGPTGTDWINAYWCDSKTLLVEIIPPWNHHPGGDCETFKSEDQIRAVKENKYHKFPKGWDVSNAVERNLKIIYNEEVVESGIRKWELKLSDKNKNDIIKLMDDHASLSKNNS